MNEQEKKFFLRIGSNKEKQYVKKIGTLFSGLMVKANYFESAHGMLSGTFLKFNSLVPPVGYIIDPVTYVFGRDPGYIKSWQKIDKDKAEEKLRVDLRIGANEEMRSNWMREIKTPTKAQKNKVEIYSIKKAYRKLADAYFANIDNNLVCMVGKQPLTRNKFNINSINTFVRNVISYQEQAVTCHYDTTKYSDFREIVSKPSIVLSPYFLIENQEDLNFMAEIWRSFDAQYEEGNGAIVLQCTTTFLEDNRSRLVDAISNVATNIIFLWIDGFYEENASSTQLEAYVKFIAETSSKGKNIANLYAGGLSPLLFPFGLYGIINNIGYGMQREAEPVEGGIPTAQFYIPTLHIRQQVLASYDLFIRNDLGNSNNDFYRDICSCPICKEGIKNGVRDFIPFYGQMDYPKSRPEGPRKYPTSVALKRCTFHFLFSRLREFKWALSATKEEAITKIEQEVNIWRSNKDHLEKLKTILKDLTST